jgi:hypothetical protein
LKPWGQQFRIRSTILLNSVPITTKPNVSKFRSWRTPKGDRRGYKKWDEA